MTGEGTRSPVVVVGAGPCGIAAGVALKQAGIAALLLEKGTVVQSVVNYPTRLTMFSTPEKLVIGGVPFECAGFRPTRQETIDYYRGVVARFALDVRERAQVSTIDRREGGFDVRTGAGSHAARAVVIATGYFDYPNMLGVPGEELSHVSHRFVDGEPAGGHDVLVVGGGNSAVEASIELARCGARVTLVHYEPGFVSHTIKPWIKPDFDREVSVGAIRVLWSRRVVAIEPGRVHLAASGGTKAQGGGAATEDVPADLVYLLTGYTPNPGLLGKLGVPFDAETGIPAHDAATMETPMPNVFVAGVLTSGKKANGVFIENGRGHGELIAAALMAQRSARR